MTSRHLRRAADEAGRCVPGVPRAALVGRYCAPHDFLSALDRLVDSCPVAPVGAFLRKPSRGHGAVASRDHRVMPPSPGGMWTLSGRGWWRGRALAAWAPGAAHRGLPGPPRPTTRQAAPGSRAPNRLSSSAARQEKIDMSRFPVENIRNFSIIAHVDHGKSTLADRLLELTGTIDKTKNNKQVLDKLQVERERGITVKAQTASLFYNHEGKQYLLNLIDTPGHVDFSYEVSRSLSACQGVLLVVDANEGIQAQTVANFFLAFEAQLSVIPVINKIDLKNADPERVGKQIEKVFDIPSDECIKISAKLGTNVESVLQAVIERIPPPKVHRKNPLRALVFDSTFDQYRGVIANVALFDGVVSKGDKVVSAHTQKTYDVNEVGILNPNEQQTHKLNVPCRSI